MADLTETVIERTTRILSLTLRDETGAPIPGTSLGICEMTIYDQATGSFVNSRDHVDIKANVSAEGVLTEELTPDDNQLIGTRQLESHIVLIEWTYGPGASKRGSAEVRLLVRNVEQVP